MNSPFDAKRYKRLLEGLEITVLGLRAVRLNNDKLRLDSGYFAKLAVQTQKLVEARPHVSMGSLCSTFRKGIFDIKAESYVDEGIPFVRIGDLRDGLVQNDNVAHITVEAHQSQKSTALSFGDVVLSKTAYPAAALVIGPECNVSQDTIAVRLSSEGKRRCNSAVLVAYLNSKYGMALMRRQFQGNVQEHLSLPDGRKIPVPLFGVELQSCIKGLLLSADAGVRKAKQALAMAESAISDALGLGDWKPPQPLTYTRRSSQAFAAGRLDAEFFSPGVSDLLTRLKAAGQAVQDVASVRRERFERLPVGEFEYIEIGDVNGDGTVSTQTVAMPDAPSRATQFVREGDVVTSTVRPIRRLSAIVLQEQDGAVASSGFVVLRSRNIQPEVLLTFLRLPVVCGLMDLHTSASLYPAISESDLMNLPFPEIGQVEGDAIVKHVRDAHAARCRARDLLSAAQRAVEIAIEQDEAAALVHLAGYGITG